MYIFLDALSAMCPGPEHENSHKASMSITKAPPALPYVKAMGIGDPKRHKTGGVRHHSKGHGHIGIRGPKAIGIGDPRHRKTGEVRLHSKGQNVLG